MSRAIVNARIWTAAPDHPWAESMVMTGDRISAVDDRHAAARADDVLDAAGQFIVPGLIDTHTHFIMGGQSLGRLDLSSVNSRAEFEAAIAQQHSELPPGAWLQAHSWSQENWDGTMPDKSWLAAAGDRPAVAYRQDSHVCLVNDAVLSKCDLSSDPHGGEIVRDTAGRPTGLMLEAAAWMIVNPIIPPASTSEKQDAVLAAQSHAHAFGLTTVQAMEYGRDVECVFEPLRDQLTIRVRINLLDRELPIDFTCGESFTNDESLAIIGYKTFLDGTFGSRTARMLADWSDAPGNRGMFVELAASGSVNDWIDEVARRGFQPSLHAIGDEAARIALNAVVRVSPTVRPRIEHSQQLDPSDVARFRGVIANMQPLHRADDGRFAVRRVGSDRLAGTFAFRKLKDAGAHLAFGSDWPIVTCDPMRGMRAAITGLTFDGVPFMPEENLTVEETLRAYTIDAAYALRFEDAVGSIEVDKLGDLVILDRNPFEIDWNAEVPRVVMTVSGGDVVFAQENVTAA